MTIDDLLAPLTDMRVSDLLFSLERAQEKFAESEAGKLTVDKLRSFSGNYVRAGLRAASAD